MIVLSTEDYHANMLFQVSVNIKTFNPVLRQRLIDMYIAEWYIDVNNKHSLILYKDPRTTFDMSCYLDKMKIQTYRNAVARLRLSS